MFSFQGREPTTSCWSLSLDPYKRMHFGASMAVLMYFFPFPTCKRYCKFLFIVQPSTSKHTLFYSTLNFYLKIFIRYYLALENRRKSLATYKSLFLCFGRNNINCDETQLNNAILVKTVRTQKMLCYKYLCGLLKKELDINTDFLHITRHIIFFQYWDLLYTHISHWTQNMMLKCLDISD